MYKNNFNHQPIENASDIDNNNGGFLLGIISAVLLLTCISVLLLFNNRQVQPIITEKINIDGLNQPSDIESGDQQRISTLLTEKTLNVRVYHPNGTIGRLTNISFNRENTVVQIAVTNGFEHTIHLNLHGKGLVLVDDLGNKFNLKLPYDNPDLEIQSGQTFRGKLVFQGGITSNANHLTLITNNQIGSDRRFSRRPKMKFDIPLQQYISNQQS